ncbi:hypothetical protein HanXRQr2_Chr11g0486191 [Helianthus annuus]|uniref:Uncharacterized protein n=1 Tax=Helianthus annuus TaxID=4232 RepID=A0A251V1S5_HELAN|nr:hypothetical protein HanXRQr2_Chr11g0486191 [Helianthus annuus]KAJ0874777.1 hypothetical protein HanPSC8_Chr11g0468301 [Helianthus annuus]
MFTPLYSSRGRAEPAVWRRSGRCATALWGVIKGEAQYHLRVRMDLGRCNRGNSQLKPSMTRYGLRVILKMIINICLYGLPNVEYITMVK